MHMLKNIQFRVESDLKQKAETLFGNLGIDMPTAFRMFLKKSVATKSIPFRVEQEEDFSKEEVKELLTILKQVKKRKGVTGPFMDSKSVLNYLHNEDIH
jgi:DNA-damage-inducible protein J